MYALYMVALEAAAYMKKSIRAAITGADQKKKARADEAARRKAIFDEESKIARQAQRRQDAQLAQSEGPSSSTSMVGEVGGKFPLGPDVKIEESERADLEIRAGLETHVNPFSPSTFVTSLVERGFNWTKKAEKCAEKCAEGVPPLWICDELGIAPSTFERWMANTEFRLGIRRCLEALSEHVMTSGLANRTHRLMAQNERWTSQKEIVRARAKRAKEDPELAAVPGATTGWIDNKGEYDASLAKEMRDTEKHGAIEVGQWNEGSPPAAKIEIVYEEKQLIYDPERANSAHRSA